MRNIDPTLGRLLPHQDGKLESLVGTSHNICVPPQVEILPFPRYPDYLQYAEQPAVVFPAIDSSWVKRNDQFPESTYVDVNPFYLSNLISQGVQELRWEWKTDTTYLLNDFLKLADHEDMHEKARNQVRGFAQRWGPLWRCRQPRHADFHHCYVSIPPSADHCRWSPSELMQEFLVEAQRAQGVLQAFMKLRNRQHVPEAVWNSIDKEVEPSLENAPKRVRQFRAPDSDGITSGWYDSHWNSSPDEGVHFGWSVLIRVIHRFIARPGGLAPRLVYDGTRKYPQIRIASSLGFLRAVWIEIAQLMSGVHQLYCCDGCGAFYQRMGRKPKEGQKNYCPTCGMEGGYKASKRQSKAQKRMQT